jgi:cold shock CspA family protein
MPDAPEDAARRREVLGGVLSGVLLCGPPRAGVVVSFDPARGMGVVRDEADGFELPFHCTAIAGGSRRVPEGAAVVYLLRAGPAGALEASGILERCPGEGRVAPPA